MFYAIFFFAWMVFNGRWTLEVMLFGFGIAAVVYLFSWKALGYGPKQEAFIFKNIGRLFKYAFVLWWEIVKATFGTLKFIMTPGDTIEPRLVYFKNPDIKSDVGKATLANSITMTPGTITCDIDDDVFIVHALDVSMSEGMGESTFVEQIKKMEEKL